MEVVCPIRGPSQIVLNHPPTGSRELLEGRDRSSLNWVYQPCAQGQLLIFRSNSFGSIRTKLKSLLCHSWAIKLWVSYLINLSLSFLLYEMRVALAPTLEALVIIK